METTTENPFLSRALERLPEVSRPLPEPHKDHVMLWGWGLTVISLFLFLLPEVAGLRDFDESSGVFLLNYLIVVGYWLVVIIHKNSSRSQIPPALLRGYWSVFLVLALISAYALNRQMAVFELSVEWLQVYLPLACAPFLVVAYYDRFSSPTKLLFHLLFGIGLPLWLYLSLYLLPLYPFAAIGSIGLGFSLHAFVPLGFLLLGGLFLFRLTEEERWLRWAAATGLGLPLLVAVFFVVRWQGENERLTATYHQALLNDRKVLPEWVAVGQHLRPDWVSRRLMQSNLVYTTTSRFWSGGAWFGGNFAEVKRHDPLVVIAATLWGTLPFSAQEQIKVLEASHDARHQAQERLWSGQDLVTAQVVTNVQLFPQHRLAYTEKTLSIRNTSTGWQNQQEALYTFQLPEGGVVTSLALWVNGVEEKGRLTTRGKAETAYKTIVGVEQRDPAVVHWQEGNTVTVRVFPCTPAEDRKLKLGVTAPLRLVGERLVYEDISFKGPSAARAPETIQVQFVGKPGEVQGPVGSGSPQPDRNLPQGDYTSLYDHVTLAAPAAAQAPKGEKGQFSQVPEEVEWPFRFANPQPGRYFRQSDYTVGWSFSFRAPALAASSFSFGGRTYQLEPLAPSYVPFAAGKIYLDLNGSWTAAEFAEVWGLVKGRQVFAHEDRLVQLTEENAQEVFARLQELQFSLFPLYKIQHPEHALLITKSGSFSPNLRDLKGTAFADRLTAFLQGQPKVAVFNLGRELSPYLRTLKEMRVFRYDHGRPERLASLLRMGSFLLDQEDTHTTVLDQTGVKIRETETSAAAGAPDHLLRLYAYNSLLKKLSRTYFCAEPPVEELMREAEQAFVVTPVSSLIVLETQADYERFDIQKSKDSLQNASTASAGAVPEPHEWLLIILALGFIGYLLLKPYLRAGAVVRG